MKKFFKRYTFKLSMVLEKEKLLELKGGNLDIDLIPKNDISWEQDSCPWNADENTIEHKCAVKGISICKYFRGVKYPDVVLCAYNKNNE